MDSIRLDQLLTQRALVDSREKAQVLIMAGEVLVNGEKVTKPSQKVKETAEIEIVAPLKYVSRGGTKLEHAVESFKIDVKGKTCMDVGSSTGGFTDCLLQYGAKKVYAVDVGRGLLHWKLRNNKNIIILENINFRYFDASQVNEQVELVTIDVSFISLDKILPKVKEVSKKDAEILALVKPQFEAGREFVKKGIVREDSIKLSTVERIKNFSENLGFKYIDTVKSPITGAKGNEEFFLYLKA